MQSTLDRIAQWMSQQDWYVAVPGSAPRLRELVEVFLPSADPTARVRVLVVEDEARPEGVIYQVPIVERDIAPEPGDPRWIGRGYGGAALFDGVGDTSYAAALLAAMHETGTLVDPADDRFVVRCEAVQDAGPSARLHVQVYGRPEITVTVYRQVLPGPHPDADAAARLAGLGVRPRLVGTLPVRWTDDDGWVEAAHLALAEESQAGLVDGWTFFAAAARAGRPVDDELRRIGAAIARMHDGFGATARRVSAAERTRTLDSWRTRLLAASHLVPGLAPHSLGAQRVLDLAENADWPDAQSVHGALELTALRRTPGGAWQIADHSGPAPAPADDRTDLPDRDLAAVLRSLDYAAGLTGANPVWAERARAALLEGAGVEETPLLVALQLDLAVFDAVSEHRTRPQAVGIPLATIARLTAARRDIDSALTAA
ncbi:trehalose biosynthesis protein [Schumannella luteola]|uniref:Putative trehalose synthase n=1 Tax=Schumannella luteola TaxID=472059 RepID=A0A852YIK4_9MICO|nr:hypothetical protein [Schumannella luteola]NYG99747.1 putative trehalose synthase [Schumannella luteola]TPX06526.1 hypothetical protein FJ656_00825 [Schumannella luteola]